jgi:zinc/manganese transport system substrate-binding protein
MVGMPRVLAILAALAVAATVPAGCGSSQPPAIPGVVRVVAGENFWGNIAAQIGGRDVRVTSILTSPAADPHLYESRSGIRWSAQSPTIACQPSGGA